MIDGYEGLGMFPLKTSIGDGYGEIVDFAITRTDKPEFYIIWSICDIHLPKPLGGYRETLSHLIKSNATKKVIEAEVYEIIFGKK